MLIKRTLLKALILCLFLGVAACSDDDDAKDTNNVVNNNTPDADHGDVDIADTDDPDTGTADAGRTDVEETDVEESDADTTPAGECAEGTEARETAAKAVVGTHTDVNSGTVEVEETADPTVYTATIDVSSGGFQEANSHSFIYLDFANGEKLEISDAEAFESTAWTIALRREVIRVNSADSGPGQWMLTQVDAPWDEVAPPGRDAGAEWLQDKFVVEEDCEIEMEGRGGIATAFGIFYDYNPQTHEVTVPENRHWVLYNPTDHKVYKFGVKSFDSSNYTITVRWAPLS